MTFRLSCLIFGSRKGGQDEADRWLESMRFPGGSCGRRVSVGMCGRRHRRGIYTDGKGG